VPAVIAGLFLAAVAVVAGQTVGHDAGFVFRLIGLPVLAAVIALGLYLYHRRKSHELIVARYELRGDALGWRKYTINAGKQIRVCAECGALVPDFKAQEMHAEWHEDLAQLLAGEPLKPVEEVPWSAVTEDAAGPEPAEQVPDEPAPVQVEPGEWEARARAFRARMAEMREEDRRQHDESVGQADGGGSDARPGEGIQAGQAHAR
jgi:hypothetical protein